MKRIVSLVPLAVWALGCGGDKHDAVTPPVASVTPQATTSATVPPPKPVAKPKPVFENPGGMWMPAQLASHKEKLKALGLELDPALLTDPNSSVLGAIVSLGGCSASFVSGDGLIATNHHCATGALQYSSSPEQNLLKNGYLAKTRAEEKSNGPAARVFVTRSVSDVSARMLDGIPAIKDDVVRYKTLETRSKEIVAACEKDKPGTRCSVARFYEGEQFHLIEQLEIRDVRLVYAPASGVGNYGGEIDNWRWPRHTGDISFFRAYVGKDGKPADYAADNVPFKPAHHLKVASTPLESGDLVFVAGYPGRTFQLKTKAEVEEAVSWSYPRRQKMCEEYIEVVEAVGKTDKDAAIKGTPFIRGFGNSLTNVKGQLEGLTKGGLASQKEKLEASLKTWIDADPKHKAEYGGALDEMAKVYAEASQHREKDASLREIAGLPKLMGAAATIVRMAEERAKKDADRNPDYQERNWKRHEQGLVALTKSYNPALDRALLSLALKRAARQPDKDRTEAVAIVAGKAHPTEAEIAKAVDAAYGKTKLEDEKVRVELLNTATVATLRASTDPLIKLAVALRPVLKAADDRDEKITGKLATLKPRYIKALRESSGAEIAPDANGTLRITYGTVRGYKPKPDAALFRPFTVLSEVVAKSTGKEPFNTPENLLAAARAKKFGPYVDAQLGEVPVDFLSDLHITGGNSGSATLNAKGELVGLVFDGNYEAMASDWLFQPEITRSIHVDIRYVLWIMDAVDGADHLLSEMGVKPAID